MIHVIFNFNFILNRFTRKRIYLLNLLNSFLRKKHKKYKLNNIIFIGKLQFTIINPKNNEKLNLMNLNGHFYQLRFSIIDTVL